MTSLGLSFVIWKMGTMITQTSEGCRQASVRFSEKVLRTAPGTKCVLLCVNLCHDYCAPEKNCSVPSGCFWLVVSQSKDMKSTEVVMSLHKCRAGVGPGRLTRCRVVLLLRSQFLVS